MIVGATGTMPTRQNGVAWNATFILLTLWLLVPETKHIYLRWNIERNLMKLLRTGAATFLRLSRRGEVFCSHLLRPLSFRRYENSIPTGRRLREKLAQKANRS